MRCGRPALQTLALPGAATVLLLLMPAAGRPAEHYYMLVFASQRCPNQPNDSHTFATFVQAEDRSSGPAGRFDSFTISWFPRTLAVRVERVHPEPGVNLDLQSSLQVAWANGARVSMWGPFEIRKELYDLALRRWTFLESGGIAYKTVDVRYRPGVASNCIHAVSDLDLSRGLLVTGPACGDRASYLVLLHLSRWIIEPEPCCPWVSDRLGLGSGPIVHRGWQGPTRLRYRPVP